MILHNPTADLEFLKNFFRDTETIVYLRILSYICSISFFLFFDAIFWQDFFCRILFVFPLPLVGNLEIKEKLGHKYLYTTTYNSRVTQKKWHKKTNAIFSSLGKNGIVPWHFFQILSWAFWVIWGWISKKVEFWDLNSEVWYLLKMYGFSPWKGKAALCATYGSKVMI